ncbi:hypothetical protein FRB96_002160 [Tulasnella sp. 330]|nr:hypothetical protein FRB96_002160 [Tulasnella sp. 330]KAG8872425.1 hypothetical protein FRB97_007644 [Tulasnella sp. 331]KAG8880121.1 hypothetical protein FRB98_005327 [Tulasnella sp. 332]
MCRPLALLFLILRFARSASVNIPLQSQIPPVGRPGFLYSFTFAAATFTPDQPQHNRTSLSYEASNVPQWAAFEPDTRTFSGTPSPTDVGSTVIQIYATEVNDSTTVDSFHLMVTGNPFPILTASLASQFVSGNPHMSSVTIIPTVGGGPGVRVQQAWSFSIGLQGNTITSPSNCEIYYAATLSDRSPLPDWMVFHQDQMTFDGVTPHDLSQGDTTEWQVVLYGSETQGYGAVQDSFFFVLDTSWGETASVGALDAVQHSLSLEGDLVPINITANDPFTFDLHSFDFKGLDLDGQTLSHQNISAIDLDTSQYPWLAFNTTAWSLCGTAPIDLLHAPPPVLPMQVLVAGNTLNTTVNVTLSVVPSVFAASIITPFYAAPLSNVSFDLAQDWSNMTSASNSSVSITATFDPKDASQWLSFSPTSYVLSGVVPESANYTDLRVVFVATSSDTHATSTTSLIVKLNDSTSSGTGNKGRNGFGVAQRRSRVLGGVLGTIFGILLLILLFFLASKLLVVVRQKWERDPFVIDHGIHGDRFVGAVAKTRAAQEDAVGMEKGGSSQSGNETRDEFETILLSGDGVIPIFTASPYSSAAAAHAMTTAKISKARFFGKLKSISARSLDNLRMVSLGKFKGEGGSRSRGGGGKENEPPSDAHLVSHTKSGRPLISRPMPMTALSSNGATTVGIPPPQSARLVTHISPPLPAMPVLNASASAGSFTKSSVSLVRLDQKVIIPTSKSLSAVRDGTGGTPRRSVSENSRLNLSDESGDMLEGTVDLTSWAEKPSYVWASAKLKREASKNRESNATSNTSNTGQSSLDSVIPKRRKDFASPPHLVISTHNNSDPTSDGGRLQSIVIVQPSSHSLSNIGSLVMDDNRLSMLSSDSSSGHAVEEDDGNDAETAEISTVTNRQQVMGLATPKRSSITSLGRDGGTSVRFLTTAASRPSTVSIHTESGEAQVVEAGRPPTRPRLVQFHSEHKAGENLTTTNRNETRSVSQTVVVSGASFPLPPPPPAIDSKELLLISLEANTFTESVATDLEHQLGLGIDYVRAFGMDSETAAEGGVFYHEAVSVPAIRGTPTILISNSGRSLTSHASGRSRNLIPGSTSHRPAYGYSHDNRDILNTDTTPRQETRSPSTASMTSSSDSSSPPSLYTNPARPNKTNRDSSLRPQLVHLPASSLSSSSTSSDRTAKVLVVEGGPFNFSVPGTEDEKIREIILRREGPVEAYMSSEDGQELVALPAWLRFDNKALEFWGVPAIEDEGGESMMLGISVWSGDMCISAFMMEIEGR